MKLAYIMLSTTWVIKSDLNQTCALNLIQTKKPHRFHIGEAHLY